MTMVILSVGLLSLAPLMLSVVRGNRFSQDMTLATALAEDRMEEIVNHLVYSDITAANFPSEARGEIQSGDPAYIKFERTVSIVDSTDILGESTMKNITITVSWRGWSQSDHTVTLYGRVVRF